MGVPHALPLRVTAIPALPSLPAAALRWMRQLRPGAPRTPSPPRGAADQPRDPLQEAGSQLRRAREERGLGLRQLAQETRISTAVIEALERGWRDRLPEPAYLRAMLPLLERHLDLNPGSLDAALPPRVSQARPAGREPLLRRFTPGSIDVFTSWQGTVLYGLVTLALIQLLNAQQFRLASRGLHSSRPIPALDNSPAAAAAGGPEASVLAAYPDLRPITAAGAGQALRRLQNERSDPGPDLALGELRLQLDGPTVLELNASRASDTRLEGVRGELALPVLPPFQLRLDPPPAGSAVRWRGGVLAPVAGAPGTYSYPPPASPRPAPAAPAAAPTVPAAPDAAPAAPDTAPQPAPPARP